MSKQEKPLMAKTDGSDMHPISKALFGWVGHKWTGRIILWGLLILSAILIGIDVFYHRHTVQDVEKLQGFYGVYGFVAFSFVVLMGRPLGWLLRRHEDYYGDADETDGGVP